jgi:hypothetical protein
MTSLLFAAVLAAAYPPAPVPPPELKTTGTPPTIAVVQVDGENLKIIRNRIVTEYRTETVTVQQGNQTVTKTVVVPVMVPVQEVTNIVFKDVTGYDTANKPIEADKLAERLKKPTPVFISGDGQPIDEAFRKLLKDDVILLTVPQQPAPPPKKVPRPLPIRPLPPVIDPALPNQPAAATAVALADEAKKDEPKKEEPKGKEVGSETHAGHFEKNNSGLKGEASFLVIADAKMFGDVFGIGRTMGPKPNFVQDKTFEAKVVIATIERGNKMVTYKVDKVTADDDTLYIAYTSTAKEATTATFNSPLIVSVDKGKYKTVVFIENGKKVGTADFPKEK